MIRLISRLKHNLPQRFVFLLSRVAVSRPLLSLHIDRNKQATRKIRLLQEGAGGGGGVGNKSCSLKRQEENRVGLLIFNGTRGDVARVLFSAKIFAGMVNWVEVGRSRRARTHVAAMLFLNPLEKKKFHPVSLCIVCLIRFYSRLVSFLFFQNA